MNNYKGLPSNNVYCTFTDNLGYLWIGTNEGVVQYNGYETKTYDMSQGVSDADVWHFFQDSKNRIWLSRISDQLGYIYNGKYHNVKRAQKQNIVFYPRYLQEAKKGVVLTTTYDNKIYLCYEQNDSVELKEFAKYSIDGSCFIAPGGVVYYNKKDTLYHASHNNNKQGYTLSKRCITGKYKEYDLLGYHLVPNIGSTIKDIVVSDIRTCTQHTIPTSGEEVIYNQYKSNDNHYIITNKSVHTFRAEPYEHFSYPLTSYLPTDMLKNNQITYITHGNLWGETISTTKEGLFLRFDTTSFSTVSTALTKYKYLGKDTRDNLYWWNKENKVIACIDSNENIITRQYPEIEQIEQVCEYSENKILMFSADFLRLLNVQDMTVTHLYSDKKYHIFQNPFDQDISFEKKLDPDITHQFGGQKGFRAGDRSIKSIVRGNGYLNYSIRGDTIIKTVLYPGRYNGILYIPKHNSCIIYADHTIIIDTKDTIIRIGDAALKLCGIRQIEQILYDDNNDRIFIKDYDNLFCYGLSTGKLTRVLSKYSLIGAKIEITAGKLAVAGRFGVLVAKIGEGHKTKILAYYPNIKRQVYNNVYDIASSGNNILFNTESGLFKVEIPVDTTIPYRVKKHSREKAYKVILNYGNQLRNIRSGDTIVINDKGQDMRFDVINPAGSGKLQFSTFFKGHDEQWNVMNGNELYLPWIKSDRYYSMSLKAKDDIWESDDLQLTVYLTPTFWQTTTGIFILWSSISLASLLIILLVIYFTRLIVSRIHEERNKLLSFKLKSVYAQINPHFIFNTLNTGLYFIKENKNREAFTHISSFSQLLRSYIKSSRNKYVTLAEEAENLEHYIKLQQYRFTDKFDYELTIDPGIDTSAALLPTMLLQPFTENAIIHGLIHKKEKGQLTIKFLSNSQKNEITCIIDDDGIGREMSAQLNRNNPNKTDSYGNELIADLVKLINVGEVIKVDIQYIDKKEPNMGTTVIITIKTLHNDKRL